MENDQASAPKQAPLFERPPGYHSYLLRFWQERSEASASAVWRFGLEDPATNRRYGFADLAALVDWLRAQIMDVPATQTDSP